MLKKILNYYANRLVSRWLILLLDLLFVTVSFSFAYALRFNFDLHFLDNYAVGTQLLVVLGSYVFGFIIFKPFSGIIRHTSIKDVENIAFANTSAFGLYLIIDYVLIDKFGLMEVLRVPLSILIIHFMVVTITMISVRFFIKSFYFTIVKNKFERKSVIIYGAGKSGLIAKHALEQDDQFKYRVAAFVDENSTKIDKKLEGVAIVGEEAVTESFLKTNHVTEIIIAIQKISPQRKRQIIDRFLGLDVIIKNIPATDQWMGGEFSSKQIKNIRIEDLLGRDEIRLDHKNVKAQIKERIVMVTGAAGSIGSEITRQLLHYKPSKIILVDQAESPLYDLTIDLEQQFNGMATKRLVKYVCDVCNPVRMEYIFNKHHPDIIYHAAAYKHVPLMEQNPAEAIEVNVSGTRNVADLAVKYGVEAFVFVSTDKAVNPTNIMGASKRIAEMYCQSKQWEDESDTHFITTRFGNVLGSNGSVVPLFRKQIERMGPITITHPEVTRYFMTIPEACELVLEAGAMGNGGEIFLFDMGESVKIIDLAKKMIKLSGYTENEIEIKTVGLRPGEKLYEEVLSDEENSLETHHPKIAIAKVRAVSHEKVLAGYDILMASLQNGDDSKLVKQIKKMVPEFKSNNPLFDDTDIKPQKTIKRAKSNVLS